MSGQENRMEAENRVRNLMWTVSGDYTLDTALDVDSFEKSKYISLYDAVKQGGGELDGYKIPLVLRFRMAEQLKDFAFIKSFTLDEVKVDSATIWTWWAHKRADILNMADKQAAYELCVNIEAAFLILDISGGMLEDVRNVQEACYTWAARAKN